jgi:hypothetical protein
VATVQQAYAPMVRQVKAFSAWQNRAPLYIVIRKESQINTTDVQTKECRSGMMSCSSSVLVVYKNKD